MPPQLSSQPFLTLQFITQRLAATPPWQLPHIVPYLASTLISCEKIIQNRPASGQTSETSEAGVVVHKLKTQISTLLHEKNPQSKWASVILIKAIIEIGGEEILRVSGAWVRGLLGILGRPDPDSTKELCIITLTRIFLLTQDHPSLIREITTPSLPGFITSCLKVLKAGFSSRERAKGNGFHSLSVTTLQALCELVPHHHTVFRPFLAQTTALVLQLIAPTPSSLEERLDGNNSAVTTSIAESSRRLFVLMNTCAPKNTSGEEWNKSLRAMINTMHRTADLVFRAVVEDWEPSTTLRLDPNHVNDFSRIVGDTEQNPLGLPSWRGINAGMERLDGILKTLQVYLNTPTPSTVNIPIGTIVDAVTRVLSVTSPLSESRDRSNGSVQTNPEIGRDEREGLWTALPNIHISALALLLALSSRLNYGSAALCHNVLEQALWIFEREHNDSNIRRIVYDLVSKILSLVGYSLPKSVAPLLSGCTRTCCEDILPPMNSPIPKMSDPDESKKGAKNRQSISADSYLKAPSTQLKISDTPTAVQISAAKLLPLAIAYTSRRLFPFALQAQIDRTAILTNNKQAMLASVLNPPLKRPGVRTMSSIMPFLARQFPDLLEVEALLRPRMPVLQDRKEDGNAIPDVDEEVGREDDDTALYGKGIENAPFPDVRGMLESDSLLAQESNSFTSRAAAATNAPISIEPSLEKPLPESQESISSIPSKKRNRDPFPSDRKSPDLETVQVLNSRALQNVDLAPNKRARFASDDVVSRNRGDEAHTYQPDTPTSKNLTAPPATAGLSSVAGPAPILQRNEERDSDDSDSFEIPPIDTGMDTGEEDDTGDE